MGSPAALPEYRLYVLNSHSGHIDRAETFVAGDDIEAISQIQARAGREPLELWRDGRKVRRFDGRPDIFGVRRSQPMEPFLAQLLGREPPQQEATSDPLDQEGTGRGF